MSTLIYLHGDHLGSVSTVTSASGAQVSMQEFDPWGKIFYAGVGQTRLSYTGQQRDDTGLLYYHARYYDPRLGRFISPDSIVPGAASGVGGAGGTVGAWENSRLTVDFHEPQFALSVDAENRLILDEGFAFQQEEPGDPSGPGNPQALNRYSYVLNNSLRYTDPTGHWAIVQTQHGAQLWLNANDLQNMLNAIGNPGNAFNVFQTASTWLAATIGAELAAAGGATGIALAGPLIAALLSTVALGVAIDLAAIQMLADSGGSLMVGCVADTLLCGGFALWGDSWDVPDGENFYKWHPPRGTYRPRPCPKSGPCAQPAPVPVEEATRRHENNSPRCGPRQRFLCAGGAR